MEALIKDLTWTHGHEQCVGDIRIRGGVIHEMGRSIKAAKNDHVISLANHYLYPGLINAHDHLHMNLYPHLGTPPYRNYIEWAKDIYRPSESPLKEIESIPLRDRLLFGGVKNLISGVTTVVHHDPWHHSLGSRHFPVRVLKKYAYANSLAFDKKVRRNFPLRSNTPYIIHAAEGVDQIAQREIRTLRDLKVLKKNTVLVHCVGLDTPDFRLIKESGASVLWCPSSNFYLFGKTADVPQLRRSGIAIALGSDSTLTGPTSLLDEMRVASKAGCVSAREVFDMVTTESCNIFNLPHVGLQTGAPADVVIAPILHSDYFENLLLLRSAQIAAVFIMGELRYGDMAIAQDLNVKLNPLHWGNTRKGIVADVSKLKENILKKASDESLNQNPLWHVLIEV